MEIAFSAEPIIILGHLTLTNTLLTSLISSLTLIIFALFISRKLSLIPNSLQNIVETVIESLHQVNLDISGKKTKLIFPWFATFFLFILVSNWMGLLPGFGSIGFFTLEHGRQLFIPLLRPVNTDLNMTLGLALVSLVATHILSVRALGARGYVSRFLSLSPIGLFVGLLEIISELTKIASLSLRLFGNIFAGETILFTTTTLLAFVVPLPFMIFEVVVGLVQALIFSMLTMVFMTILMTREVSEKAHGV